MGAELKGGARRRRDQRRRQGLSSFSKETRLEELDSMNFLRVIIIAWCMMWNYMLLLGFWKFPRNRLADDELLSGDSSCYAYFWVPEMELPDGTSLSIDACCSPSFLGFGWMVRRWRIPTRWLESNWFDVDVFVPSGMILIVEKASFNCLQMIRCHTSLNFV